MGGREGTCVSSRSRHLRISQLESVASVAPPATLARESVISSAQKPCCDVSNGMAHRRVVEKECSNDIDVGASSGRRKDRWGGGPGAWANVLKLETSAD